METQRVYYYTASKYALESIRKKRIKVSRIEDLNDPFEMLACDISDEFIQKVFTMTRKDLDKKAGIVCFSKDWHNTLLWAHYGDKHKGICIGFDIDSRFTEEITYIKTKWSIEDLNTSDKEQMKKILLFSKYEKWEYENEIRAGFALDEEQKENGMYFSDFDQALMPKEIILGCRNKTTPKEIRSALDEGNYNHHIKVIQTKVASREFSIIEDRMKTKGLARVLRSTGPEPELQEA